MDTIRRKKKTLVRVNWDNGEEGAWHYVPISSLKVASGSELAAGEKVTVKYGSKLWTGCVAASRKRRPALAFGKFKRFPNILFEFG